jgi:hypothetical protein
MQDINLITLFVKNQNSKKLLCAWETFQVGFVNVMKGRILF